MPYILNKTNGTIITTVQDASIDQTTDLIFVGRNYAGYGEWQNENFLKLLENFANTGSPTKKIEGQLWYDTANKKLNFYDSNNWKAVANLQVSVESPAITLGPAVGDFWYNTIGKQVSVWNGIDYTLVGPPTGADIAAQWRGDFEYDKNSRLPVNNIKAVIGATNEVVAIVSAETYTMSDYIELPTSDTPAYPAYSAQFTNISKGITLLGADPVTGSSEANGIYFWGTAKHASSSTHAATSGAASGISAIYTATNLAFNVPFINTTTNTAYYHHGIKYNPSTGVLSTIASSALYADLAERYAADAVYETGTVLMHGGTNEVTIATQHATPAVAGIVSKNPAYMMNSEAGTDETHPYIVLKGRISCKIVGSVKKGDLLVASGYRHGHACVMRNGDNPHAVIGKALEDFEGSFGIIEVKV